MSRVGARESRGDSQAEMRVGVMRPSDDIAQVRVRYQVRVM